jgi:outer membrane protein assembly factor BamD
MRPCFKGIAFLVLAGSLGCGSPKGAKLQISVVPPDKALYQAGNEYLEKSQFIKARLAYQTLLNTYPGSELEPDAFFASADSFYREGGTENLLMAVNRFSDFITFFPTNAKAPDALLKEISILLGQMRSPDRDQQETEQALEAIHRFLVMYPDNDYVPLVKQYRVEAEESLALRDLGVGDFNAGRGNYAGASMRYKDIAEKYPHFSRADEVNFKLAKIHQMSGDTEQAADYLSRIVAGYPFSKYSEAAKQELLKMGKPFPAVDSQLAAQNLALLKTPEPLSPLKLLADFVAAMGFKSPPNRYDEARRAVTSGRGAPAPATGAEARGSKPGEVLITGTIDKSGDAKAVTASPPAGNAADKKKTDVKNKKKWQ